MTSENSGTTTRRERLRGVSRKTKALLVVLTLLGALATGGTYSYFADTDETNQNTVEAGSLDVVLDETNGEHSSSFTIGSSGDGKPTDSATHNFSIENGGSLSADHLQVTFTAKEVASEPAEPSDSDINAELNADETASLIEVNRLEYQNGSGATLKDILGAVTDANGNGIKDLQDVIDQAATQDDLTPPAANRGNKTHLVVEVAIANDDSAGFTSGNTAGSLTGNDEDIMADGAEIIIEFTLNQDASQ